jgi:hypothetical protein
MKKLTGKIVKRSIIVMNLKKYDNLPKNAPNLLKLFLSIQTYILIIYSIVKKPIQIPSATSIKVA